MFKNLDNDFINFCEDYNNFIDEHKNDDKNFLFSIKKILSDKKLSDSTKIKFIIANSLDYASNSYKTELFEKDFFDYVDKC